MSDLATKAVEVALAEIGVKEDPPGSNRGPRVDEYLRAVGLDPAAGSYPWCASFVSWCVKKAAKALGVTPEFTSSAGALKLLAKNPRLRLPHAEPNCVFIQDHGKGKGHVGFVVAVDVKDPDVLWTVEGNSNSAGSRTGGEVIRQKRRASDCKGFLRVA